MQDITLSLEKREVVGKKVKHLRNSGKVPAVIHDHGKESVHVMGPYVELMKTYQSAGGHHPITLEVGKQRYMALIKDADFEPKKRKLRHLVFNAIRQDQKVEAEIPVHIEGEIPAEKAGFMVIKQLDHVLVESLPKDLPEGLAVDGAKLAEIGDSVTVADIPVPSGVAIMTEAEHPIAVVEETKAQISEESTEEGTEEAGEVPSEHGGDKAEEAAEEE